MEFFSHFFVHIFYRKQTVILVQLVHVCLNCNTQCETFFCNYYQSSVSRMC